MSCHWLGSGKMRNILKQRLREKIEKQKALIGSLSATYRQSDLAEGCKTLIFPWTKTCKNLDSLHFQFIWISSLDFTLKNNISVWKDDKYGFSVSLKIMNLVQMKRRAEEELRIVEREIVQYIQYFRARPGRNCIICLIPLNLSLSYVTEVASSHHSVWARLEQPHAIAFSTCFWRSLPLNVIKIITK